MVRYSDNPPAEYPHFLKEKLVQYEGEIINELTKLDLNPNEAKILLYLMLYNNSTASEIARFSGIQRTETYHYLASLLAKGVVRMTFDRPQRYHALSFKEAIDHLVKVKTSSLDSIMEKKEYYHEIVTKIVESVVQRTQLEKDVYQVIIGKEPLIAKLQGLIQNAKREITLLLSEAEVMVLYRNNLTEELSKSVSRGIRVSVKTSSSNVSSYINEEGENANVLVKVIDSPSPVGCIIFDEEEMVAFIESNASGFRETGLRAFYTNNRKLVSVFKVTADRS